MKTSKVFLWSVTVALCGFLFGFDTAVISGAEQSIQKLWGLDGVQHGLTTSIALIGTVIGAIFGGLPADKWGRKNTLFAIAILFLVSAAGSALAPEWYSFLFFRFIGGLGVGASSVAAPMYISEISPAEKRGRRVALFQFNIVFGILIAFLSNFLILQWAGGFFAWRWMLGAEVFPAVVFLSLVLFVPKSPRWLIIKKGKIDEALKTLRIINPQNAETQVQEILAAEKAITGSLAEPFFSKKYSFPIMLAFLIAFFNQVSGINAIIYYAPRIFSEAGLESSAAFLSTAGIGLINFIFTILAINVIDRFGRRTLMFVGSLGLIATLAMVSMAFFMGISGYLVPISLFIYIGFFAFSQGAVIWVFISEVFPNSVRAKGQSFGSSTHWILAALITFIIPSAHIWGYGPTFLFFCLMMVLQLLFVWKIMPETKGKTLEELELSLTGVRAGDSGAKVVEKPNRTV
jgi:sugar porter (SP) family MFS transporter